MLITAVSLNGPANVSKNLRNKSLSALGNCNFVFASNSNVFTLAKLPFSSNQDRTYFIVMMTLLPSSDSLFKSSFGFMYAFPIKKCSGISFSCAVPHYSRNMLFNYTKEKIRGKKTIKEVDALMIH